MRCRNWVAGSLAAAALWIVPGKLLAQPAPVSQGVPVAFEAGVGLANKYVWRGLELDDGMAIQPFVTLSTGLLEVGTWGSHGKDGGYHEQDFWARYYFPTGPDARGRLSVTVTDYYVNPDFGEDFFDFRGVGACETGQTGFGRPPRCARGAHTVEVAGTYSSAVQPFDLLVAYNFHNDPEDSIYLEGTVRPVVLGFQLTGAVGGVTGRSRNYYGNEKATLINLTAGIGREIPLGPIRLPVAAEVVHNPEVGKTYYVARGFVAVGN